MNGEPVRDPLSDTGHHPLYRGYESRRAYPRVKLRLPVQIGLPGGQVVCARIYNISPDGMQVRCSPEAALTLNPGGKAGRGAGCELLVALRLRHHGNVRTHVLRCALTYMLPENREEVIIGLSFQSLMPEQQAAIDAVVGASLEPVSGS